MTCVSTCRGVILYYINYGGFEMDRQTRLYDNFDRVEQKTIEEILTLVYNALEERGYNAIDQMVGYILSGDPSYITSHNNARNVMGRIERDDLVEELIKSYLSK